MLKHMPLVLALIGLAYLAMSLLVPLAARLAHAGVTFP